MRQLLNPKFLNSPDEYGYVHWTAAFGGSIYAIHRLSNENCRTICNISVGDDRCVSIGVGITGLNVIDAYEPFNAGDVLRWREEFAVEVKRSVNPPNSFAVDADETVDEHAERAVKALEHIAAILDKWFHKHYPDV